jgi:hypothetical protein
VNPQDGPAVYAYYPSGTLKSASVGGGYVSSTYCYDALNRPTSRLYNDGKTFTVSWGYDTARNGAGYLATTTATNPQTNTSYSTTFDAYDAVGRVLHSTQTVGTQAYPLAYSYNEHGDIETLTYPSGNVVNTCVDSMARPSTVTQNGATHPYVTVTDYAPHGEPRQITLGNGLTESTSFDSKRLQLTQVTVSNSLLQLNYYYCPNAVTSCSTNNGNIQRQVMQVGTFGGDPGLMMLSTAL